MVLSILKRLCSNDTLSNPLNSWAFLLISYSRTEFVEYTHYSRTLKNIGLSLHLKNFSQYSLSVCI